MRQNLPMLLVRMIVGLVFLTEGILKYMYPDELGAGRFAHIGLPFPHILAPVVGAVEIAGGGALLLNVYAGDAALLLLCVAITALATTKVPVALGHGYWHFGIPRGVAHTGALGFIHEARTDLAMFFCLIAVLIEKGMRVGQPRKWYAR